MTATKELRWNDLTAEEKEVATNSGILANPKDFNYHRVLGELFACSDDHSWTATVGTEHSDKYPDLFGWMDADDDSDAYATGAVLIPITTDVELTEEQICKNYLGVELADTKDLTVGF